MKAKEIKANYNKVFRIANKDGDGERLGRVIAHHFGSMWKVRFLDGSKDIVMTMDILGLSERQEFDDPNEAENGTVDDEEGPAPEHPLLTEAFIDANIDRPFLFVSEDGEWEGTITGRCERYPDCWDVRKPDGSLRVVTRKEIVALKDSAAPETLAPPAGTGGDEKAWLPPANLPTDEADAGRSESAVAEPVAGEDYTGGGQSDTDPEAETNNSSHLGNNEPVRGNDEPDESWALPELAQFITRRLCRTLEDTWWIGKALAIANKRHTENRDWLRWLKAIGISKSSAYRYMDLCDGYTLDEIKARPGASVSRLLDELHDTADVDDEEEDNDACDEDGEERYEDSDEDADEDHSCDDDGDGDADEEDEDGDEDSAENGQAEDHDDDEGAEEKQPPTLNGVPTESHNEAPALPEVQPPITHDEFAALEAFVQAVGGWSRAGYVLREGHRQAEDMKDDVAQDGDCSKPGAEREDDHA
jgi:hypothetical protein